jgi:RNA polymerase sigma factor (sigma-70 family)
MHHENFPGPEDTTTEADKYTSTDIREPVPRSPGAITALGETTLTATAAFTGEADTALLSLIHDVRHLKWIARRLAEIGVYHLGAEDVWQLAIMRSLGRDITPDKASAYAAAAAENYILSLGRRQGVQYRAFGYRIPDADAQRELADADDGAFSRMEENEVLSAALMQLPSRTRRAVILRYVEQLTVPEAAEAMGCAEGTIKSLCSRGMIRLRLLLGARPPMIDIDIE